MEVKKKNFIIKVITACLVTASLFCCSAYADGFFYDFEELSDISSTKPIPTPSEYKKIYLDSSKVDHPVLRGVFPSPSEYKAKSNLSADVFQTSEKSGVSVRNYKVEALEDLPELKFSETKSDEMNFENMGFFAPPSEYPKTERKTAKKQQVDTAENRESYHASAEMNQNNDNPDLEGKTITSITFKGLNRINENSVLNVINTKTGSLFNAARLQTDLQNIYELGFFTDSMYIDPSLNSDGTASVEFVLQENPIVKEVKIEGNTVFSQNELLTYTKDLQGMPQNINMINESIEMINMHYEENGYILGKVSNIDDTSDGTLIISITEGVIDKITFEGANKTKDYVIRRNMLLAPGSVYNEELLKKDLAKVYETQIFDEVSRKIEPSPEHEGEYIVTVVVKEASSNSVSIGGGIDNALGVFGSAKITEKNFLGRAQEVNLSGMIGSGLLLSDQSIKNRMNYQIELSFKEPHFINSDNSLLSKMYIRELGSYKIPLAIERRFGWNTILEHKLSKGENWTSNLGVGFENIHLKEGDYNRIASQYAVRGLDIAKRAEQLTGGSFFNIAPGIRYSTIDSEFMPRDGMIAQASFIESLGVDNLKNSNSRVTGGITKFIPVGEKSTLSLTTKGGLKVIGDHMPEVMSFSLGGPYSIRGFRMYGVGSGNSFIMGSAEIQTPIPFMDRFKYDVLKNLRLAFFMDAGRVFDPTITSKLYDRPNSAISIGLGLRINIPGMGPISVDYGLPLTNVGRYNKQHGYFTFGTGGLYDSFY